MPKLQPVSYRRLAKVFLADGWEYKRTKGDHDCYTKPGFNRPVVIPRYKELGVAIIMSSLRTAGISRERYFELLDGC